MFRYTSAVWIAFALLAVLPANAEPVERLPVEAFFGNQLMRGASISPNGRFVVAVASRFGHEIIMVTDLETGKWQPLLRFSESDPGFRIPKGFQLQTTLWANDERILFTAIFPAPQVFGYKAWIRQLYAVDRDGKNLTNLSEEGEFFYGFGLASRLHADPKHILIELGDTVHRVNVYNGRKKRVQRDIPKVSGWMADHAGKIRFGIGRRNLDLTYKARRTGKGSFETIAKRTVPDDPAFDVLGFGFDPDTLYVASNHESDHKALYEFDIVKKEFSRKLYEHPGLDVEGPLFFSRKRKKLLGIGYLDETAMIHFLDDSFESEMAQIDSALPGRVNRVSSLSNEEDRALVVSRSDTDAPTTYVYLVESKQLIKLFDGYPALEATTLAAMQPIRFTARDGLEIGGYLTTPVGVPAENLPLVVHPHGGPSSRDVRGFDPAVQFLANRGFAVLQVNFRGSSGFGSNFEKKSRMRWGFEMQDDLTDGVRWLIERGTVDPDRVAIYGGSYGGYAALMALVKEPELFRCGISLNGVTDLMEHVRGEVHLGFEDFAETVELGGTATHAKRLVETSPARNADRIAAPVLIGQGKRDWRVHPDQAQIMSDALRKAGKPHKLLWLESESHGLQLEHTRLEFYSALGTFLDANMKVLAGETAAGSGAAEPAGS